MQLQQPPKVRNLLVGDIALVGISSCTDIMDNVGDFLYVQDSRVTVGCGDDCGLLFDLQHEAQEQHTSLDVVLLNELDLRNIFVGSGDAQTDGRKRAIIVG
jgi:hypothetical protein